MPSHRPVDSFVERASNILKKEYLIIGKKRVSSSIAWSAIAFLVGVTVATAFLASRSGMLELTNTEAATPQQLAAGEILGAQRYKDGLVAGMSRYGVQVPPATIDLVEQLIQQARTSYDQGDFESARALAKDARARIDFPNAQSAIRVSENFLRVVSNNVDRKLVSVPAPVLSDAQALLAQANTSFAQGDYVQAVVFANQAKARVDYFPAQRDIKQVEGFGKYMVFQAGRQKIIIPDSTQQNFMNLLVKANDSFVAGAYTDASDYARQARETIDYVGSLNVIAYIERFYNSQKSELEKGRISRPKRAIDEAGVLVAEAKKKFDEGLYPEALRLANDAQDSLDQQGNIGRRIADARRARADAVRRNAGDLVLQEFDTLFTQADQAYKEGRYRDAKGMAEVALQSLTGVPVNGGNILVVTAPRIIPNGGEFSGEVMVLLQTPTVGAQIYYTTDGSAPNTQSTLYTAPLQISQSGSLKAIAYQSANGGMQSAESSASFTILPQQQVLDQNGEQESQQVISISPYKEGGYAFRGSVQISLKSSDASAIMYYTTDGRTPNTSNGTRYTNAFTLSRNGVVKASAFNGGAQVGGTASAAFINEATPGSVAYKQLSSGQPWFGEHRRDVLLINLLNAPTLTKAEAERQVFTDPEKSMNAFYQTISFGQVWFTGNVYGPYDVPIDGREYIIRKQSEGLSFAGACTTLFSEARRAAEERARADGYNPSLSSNSLTTKTIVFINYQGCEGTLGVPAEQFFSGRVPIGPRSDIGSINIIHQVHDKAGNLHSHGVACGSKSIDKASACTFVDVADPFDVAGHVWEAYNLFPLEKIDIGWLTPDRVQDISRDGTYALYTSSGKEFPQTGPVLARITKPDTNTSSNKSVYYIDYRQPVAADASLARYPGFTSGINIHVTEIKDKYNTNGSGLLDLTPGSNPAGCTSVLRGYGACPFLDAALSDGRAFVDDINGIKITQISHDTQKVTIKVEFTQSQSGGITENIPTLPPISLDLPPINMSLAFTYPDLAVRTLLPNPMVVNPNDAMTATARVFNRNFQVPVGKTFPIRLYPHYDATAQPSGYGAPSSVADQMVNLVDPDFGTEREQEITFTFRAPSAPGWKTAYVIVDNGDPGSVRESDDSLESNRRAWRYYVVDPKFAAGKRVVTNRAVNIYGGTGTTWLASQPQGAAGTTLQTTPDINEGTAWVYVNFDDGKRGHVFVDFLAPL